MLNLDFWNLAVFPIGEDAYKLFPFFPTNQTEAHVLPSNKLDQCIVILLLELFRLLGGFRHTCGGESIATGLEQFALFEGLKIDTLPSFPLVARLGPFFQQENLVFIKFIPRAV